MSTQEVIGGNIRQFRKIQQLTQNQLAEYLNVSREQISNYERGERNISVAELEKLSNLFGAELADLLEENPDQQKLNLAFAFRSDNTAADLEQIANFKKVALNYLKMQRLNQ